jgi:hypothetical protein
MKTMIIFLTTFLVLSCTEPSMIDEATQELKSNDSTALATLAEPKTIFRTDFSQWTSFGYPRGWYMNGNPVEYNTYVIEKVNNQCKITIRKEDYLKNAYLRTFDLLFQYGHTYKVSIDVIDISQWNNNTVIRAGLFTGDNTKQLAWEFWPKTNIVGHYEWTVTVSTIQPQQCFFYVVISFGNVFTEDQWIVIDNLDIVEQ